MGGDYDLIDDVTNLDDDAEYISSNGMYFIGSRWSNSAAINVPVTNTESEISPEIQQC